MSQKNNNCFHHLCKYEVRQYWKNLFSSTRKKMSRGASNISKIISWARGENWRRNTKRSEKKFLHHNDKK